MKLTEQVAADLTAAMKAREEPRLSTLRMLKAGAGKTGITEALITGGVAASGLLRQTLEERIARTRGCPQIVFGRPDMSGDNAVGVALIGAERLAHT